MVTDPQSPQDDSDLDLQQEIMRGRKFTLADVIGREGGSFMKGESPVPKLVQAKTEIDNYVCHTLSDPSGSLYAVLRQWIHSYDDEISHHLEQPLVALGVILHRILENRELFYELVRQVDVQWGQMNDERPYFQRPGQPAHPEDEYTHESVDQNLRELLDRLSQSRS